MENKQRFQLLEEHFQDIMKAIGKRPMSAAESPEDSRYRPETSNRETQVPARHWEHNRDESQLGYRSGQLNLANREHMLKKLEMPKFEGTNAHDWIVDVEHFFTVGRFRDSELLDMIALCVEGKIKKWFAWVLKRGGFRDWMDFKQQLIYRFAEAIDDEPETRLFSLRQTGSVADYVSEFEELSSQVTGLEDKFLERIFYNGLSQEMKEVIKIKDPQGLSQFIAVVLRMETSTFCKVMSGATKEDSQVHNHRSYTGGKSSNTVGFQRGNDSAINKENQPARTNIRPRQQFSDAELDKMRKDKICFRCKAPWTPAHKQECPNKALRVLTVINGLQLEVVDQFKDTEEDDFFTPVVQELRTLSFSSFLGLDSPRTTKLRGCINNK